MFNDVENVWAIKCLFDDVGLHAKVASNLSQTAQLSISKVFVYYKHDKSLSLRKKQTLIKNP